MAKENKKVEQVEKKEMTLEEAKAYRASLYKPVAVELTEEQKREQFRMFWAQNKRQYGKSKDIEEIIWLHLKAIKMDKPEKFQDGINHFGLKKIK